MRDYFRSLIEQTLSAVDPDPKRFVEALRRAVEEMRAGRNPLDEGGLIGLLATAEQQQAFQKVQGLMSLLEGHGDVTMDRAGADRLPSAERFSRVLRQRRNSVRGPAKILQQLVGLEAKMRQYEQGEQFIEAVERVGGPALLAKAWNGPDALPTATEIRDPDSWIRRMGAGAMVHTS
jgi:putative hydrolase